MDLHSKAGWNLLPPLGGTFSKLGVVETITSDFAKMAQSSFMVFNKLLVVDSSELRSIPRPCSQVNA